MCRGRAFTALERWHMFSVVFCQLCNFQIALGDTNYLINNSWAEVICLPFAVACLALRGGTVPCSAQHTCAWAAWNVMPGPSALPLVLLCAWLVKWFSKLTLLKQKVWLDCFEECRLSGSWARRGSGEEQLQLPVGIAMELHPSAWQREEFHAAETRLLFELKCTLETKPSPVGSNL